MAVAEIMDISGIAKSLDQVTAGSVKEKVAHHEQGNHPQDQVGFTGIVQPCRLYHRPPENRHLGKMTRIGPWVIRNTAHQIDQ